MLFGNGKARSGATRRPGPAFRPGRESLEGRIVLTAFDLAQITGPAINTTGLGPYGLQEIGATPSLGAGYSVAAVGDVNGDGFQDFVIGAPSVQASTTTGGGAPYVLNNIGTGSTAYLVLGSAQAATGGGSVNTDWLTLTQAFRSGDLGLLGSASQTNPILGTTGANTYNFNGLTLTTTGSSTSELGASAAGLGDLNGDGISDFAIGAPGLNGGNGGAYIVYGSSSLGTRTTKTLDLNTGAPDVAITLITNTTALGTASATGASVSRAGTFLNDGGRDIAIGAPNSSINGLTNNGAVYVIPNGLLASPAIGSVKTIDLSTIGQGATTTTGVVFSGASSGAAAGFSVADANNVGGVTVGSTAVDAMIIGAPAYNPFTNPTSPSVSGPGAAYLVYGGTNFQAVATTPATGGFLTVPLNYAGGTGTTTSVPGATLTGATNGDRTGYSVSSAGDFNGDGFADVLIGSPGFLTNTGRVNLIYGSSLTGSTPVKGIFTLSNLPTTVTSAEFDGTAQGDLAGYSVAANGNNTTTGSKSSILIGSPGALSNAGAVYLIPGVGSLTGTNSLSSIQTSPLNGSIFTNSTVSTGVTSKNFLGSSVSGILNASTLGRTSDSDTLTDFVIGSSGYSLNTSRTLAGAAFFIQGQYLPTAVTPAAFAVPIGVDAPAGASSYNVSATTPASILIAVDSVPATTTNAAFNPVTDIVLANLTIDGKPFSSFTSVTIAQDPVDENGDGIPDAILTVTPRSALALANGTQTFTLTGTTATTAANPSTPFTGTTQIIVTGGSGGGGGGGGGGGNLPAGGSTAGSFGFPLNNVAGSTIGERLVPAVNTLSKLHWKAIPLRVAYQQYLPPAGFRQREFAKLGVKVPASHSSKSKYLYGNGSSGDNGSTGQRGVSTLAGHVFDRGVFKINAKIGSYHKVPKKGYIG